MNLAFYKKNTTDKIQSSEFQHEQKEFKTKSEVIKEVQNKYKLYIDHYLQKDQSRWVDSALFDLIDAEQYQKKVITYIDFETNNNPKNLNSDDLTQLKNLKKVLENKDYKEDIYNFPNSVNFWILSWKYIEKYWKESNIIYNKIQKLRKNRFKLLLQKEWTKNIDKYQINYDWSDYVSIYNQFWIRLWREKIEKSETIFIKWNKFREWQYQTRWKLTLNTHKNKIELELIFIN